MAAVEDVDVVVAEAVEAAVAATVADPAPVADPGGECLVVCGVELQRHTRLSMHLSHVKNVPCLVGFVR